VSNKEMDLIMAAMQAGKDGDQAAVHKNMGELVQLRFGHTVEWLRLELLAKREAQIPKERAKGLVSQKERDILKVYRWPSPDGPPPVSASQEKQES
jgi:hypothetical protein